MTQAFRLPQGGSVDRARSLRFTFDGVAYTGFAGDTLASALLANGVHLVARSFKYHRPRGILTAGVEEPNALVQVGEGARDRAERPRDHARALRRAGRGEPESLAVAAHSMWARQRRLRRDCCRRASTTRPSCGRRRRAGGCATSTAIRRAAGMGRRRERARSRSLRASLRALRRAGHRRRPRRPRGGARRGARRRARPALRRASELGGSLQGEQATIDGAPCARVARSDAARAGVACPTSRCCAARPRSATTTATWSGSSSASPIISPRTPREHAAPAPVEGPRQGGGARQRRASSAASPTSTTTCPA